MQTKRSFKNNPSTIGNENSKRQRINNDSKPEKIILTNTKRLKEEARQRLEVRDFNATEGIVSLSKDLVSSSYLEKTNTNKYQGVLYASKHKGYVNTYRKDGKIEDFFFNFKHAFTMMKGHSILKKFRNHEITMSRRSEFISNDERLLFSLQCKPTDKETMTKIAAAADKWLGHYLGKHTDTIMEIENSIPTISAEIESNITTHDTQQMAFPISDANGNSNYPSSSPVYGIPKSYEIKYPQFIPIIPEPLPLNNYYGMGNIQPSINSDDLMMSSYYSHQEPPFQLTQPQNVIYQMPQQSAEEEVGLKPNVFPFHENYEPIVGKLVRNFILFESVVNANETQLVEPTATVMQTSVTQALTPRTIANSDYSLFDKHEQDMQPTVDERFNPNNYPLHPSSNKLNSY